MADSSQVVLNSGGDQYQTVTIVPSDGQGGEVNIFYLFAPKEPLSSLVQSLQCIPSYLWEPI